MSEGRKIDWSVVKPAVIGLGTFGLALSIAVMVDMSRQNTDLRRDLSELRSRFDQSQQNLALLQRLPSTQLSPAPPQAPAVQPQPVAPPAEAAPVHATGTSLTFEMLVPGEAARPPIPLKAPLDGVPKSVKREQSPPKREERRDAPPEGAVLAQADGEKPHSKFNLLDKTAAEQPRTHNFKLLGQ